MQAGLLFSLWSRVKADAVEEGHAEEGPQVGIVCSLLHLEGSYQKDAERAKVKGPKERVQVVFRDCQPEARFHTHETVTAVQSSLGNSGCLVRDAYSEAATFRILTLGGFYVVSY